jgi:peptidoglycan hydrolase-like protein with peptidoglycan-binding domain
MTDTKTERQALVAAPVPRRRRRRGRVVVAGVVTVAVLGGAAWYGWREGWFATGAATAEEPASQGPPATAEIERRTLVHTEEVQGTLGYGDERLIKGGRAGTVTGLPAEGRTVSRGQTVYLVDEVRIPLLYGTLPLYRTLEDGVEGNDVLQLERNLEALGYNADGAFTVDDEFTDNTAAAVEEWQDDLGVEETGTISPGDVVIAASAVRVDDHKVEVGNKAGAGQPILGYTATTRSVTIDLNVDDQELAKVGGKVTVTLPDDKEVGGKVSSVGSVVEQSDGGDNQEPTSTVDVVVQLDDPKTTGTLDQAPVDVEFVSDQRKDVLTVPVGALLALREGGYGVEVVTDTGTRIVAVEVGMFADGNVEISGAGLAEGMKVGVPPS